MVLNIVLESAAIIALIMLLAQALYYLFGSSSPSDGEEK